MSDVKFNEAATAFETRFNATNQQFAAVFRDLSAIGGTNDYNKLLNKPIQRIESLDTSNLVNFRDLDSGQYLIYGYFSPYANSDISISADNSMISVVRKDAGSHVICLDPLNAKIVFFEILVDESQEKGFTYTRTIIPVLDLHALIAKVGDLEGLNTDAKDSVVSAINEINAALAETRLLVDAKVE